MGGGDLNMKKSWHPLLQVNQERVWKREQEASEERKKLEELRREREQEREMQELQRLQEEAGGKKRIEKVDWMYAPPAASSGPSSTEMEDYLLGKKRVDKLLKADDTPAASRSDKTSFISLQNANNSRDLAAKLREDPMLAIKQREQAAYEALLRDPSRLRQMKRKADVGTKNPDETEEERRRRRKEERRRRHDDAKHRHRLGRAIEADERHPARPSKDDHQSVRGQGKDRTHSRRYGTQRHRDIPHNDDHRHPLNRGHRQTSDNRGSDEEQSSLCPTTRRARVDLDQGKVLTCKEAGTPPCNPSSSAASCQEAGAGKVSRHERGPSQLANDELRNKEKREAKLREMTQNAASMQEQRSSYVARINTEEAEEERHEAQLRQKLLDARQKGQSDGRGAFLLGQQRNAFGGNADLADRIKRGRTYQSFDS